MPPHGQNEGSGLIPQGAVGFPLAEVRGQSLRPHWDDKTHYRIQNTFTAIPMLLDGSPNWDHRLQGDEVVVGNGIVEVMLATTGDVKPEPMMLVFHEAPGTRHCIAVDGVSVRRTRHTHVTLEGHWGGPAEALLESRNLVPRFVPEAMEFRLPLPDGVLARWAEVGVAEPTLIDRILVCPACEGLPTFRPGCRRCGSALMVQDRLVHHFACANVGSLAGFESAGGMVCPKCRIRGLVVGSDFEFLRGRCECQECHWTDATPEQVGQCLRCELRFPGHQAHEKELRGYRVQRLDLLALTLPV